MTEENENVLCFESTDNKFMTLFVSYDVQDQKSKEYAEASSLLEGEIRSYKNSDEFLEGLVLTTNQVPEVFSKHFIGNIKLYGTKTRFIFRFFKKVKNEWVQTPFNGLKEF